MISKVIKVNSMSKSSRSPGGKVAEIEHLFIR